MKLDSRAFGIASGLLIGLAGFVATLLSLLNGAGQTITVLAAVYFGYSWSIVGAVLALGYGIVYGFIGGWVLAALYNRFAAN